MPVPLVENRLRPRYPIPTSQRQRGIYALAPDGQPSIATIEAMPRGPGFSALRKKD